MQNPNFFSLKFSDGEDVVGGILNFAKEKEIEYGEIVSGRGKIRDFELVSTGQKRALDRLFYAESFSISAISGKLHSIKGEMTHSINVSITKSGYNATKGQLLKATADGPVELTIRKVNLGKIIEA